MWYTLKQFFRRIYNLYRWFPIIWKDQDWDDHYIWEILKFKIRNQADYIRKHDRYVDAQRDAEKMYLCYRLIDDVQREFYACEYQYYHQTEIKFVPSDRCKDCTELDIVEVSERFDEYFTKYPRIYQQVVKAEPGLDKYRIAFRMASVNHKRARKLLFNILEQNIERWWD